MRKFKNSPKIAFRKLRDIEKNQRVQTDESLQLEAEVKGVTVAELRTIKYAEARRQQLLATAKEQKSTVARVSDNLTKPPKREPTRRAEPPKFKGLPKTQRWDGKRWVKITELERETNG